MPAIIIQVLLIRFSQDDEDQTIDKRFMENFSKRVDSIQILPNGASIVLPPDSHKTSPILLCFKNRDRWLALASCLLKSQVYHHIVVDPNYQNPRSIVELPRSQYNRPYIPQPVKPHPQQQQDPPPRYDAFSVSHQWPFAGVAFNAVPTTTSDMNSELLQVGFDIVVFDPPNEKLYQSTLEFVEVFHDQFTPKEWQKILDCQTKFDNNNNKNDLLLCEFYLQWAVKEAYTKARGLGLNINFADFETLFENSDPLREGVDGGLWRWIESNDANGPLPLKGTLVDRCSCTSNLWQFFFLPLFVIDPNELQNKTYLGCGCVCIGPLPTGDIDIETKWSDINNLMEWHYHQDNQTQG